MQLTSLEHLDISDNRIFHLPLTLSEMKLTVLKIKGNPIKGIPKDIIAAGGRDVLIYLDKMACEKNMTKCARVKLMFVGEENVGKSTFLFYCLDN